MAKVNEYAIAQDIKGNETALWYKVAGIDASRKQLIRVTEKLVNRGWQVKTKKANSAILLSPTGKINTFTVTKV